MAEEKVFVVGRRVSVKEKGKTVEGVVSNCNPDGSIEVDFDDKSQGIYDTGEQKDLVILETPQDDAPPEDAEIPEDDTVTLENTVTIPKSRVVIASSITSDPVKLAAEEKRQKKLQADRHKRRVAKISAKPLKPIKQRENLLKARLKKVQMAMIGRGTHTYRKEQVNIWSKELALIQSNPGAWRPGCIRAKKKQSAQEILDGLNLD